MRPARPRLPSPAMMVALLALFVALTGGAYAAAKIGAADIKVNAVRSKHIKAKEVKLADLAPVAKFRRVTPPVAEQTVLRLGGLHIVYSCALDAGFFEPQLTARTTVDNAFVDLGFVTGPDGSGASFWATNIDLDTTEPFDLDRNRLSGRGTLVYSRPGGQTVSLTYGFVGGLSICHAHGVATGG